MSDYNEPDLFYSKEEVDRQTENAFFIGWVVGMLSAAAITGIVLWMLHG